MKGYSASVKDKTILVVSLFESIDLEVRFVDFGFKGRRFRAWSGLSTGVLLNLFSRFRLRIRGLLPIIVLPEVSLSDDGIFDYEGSEAQGRRIGGFLMEQLDVEDVFHPLFEKEIYYPALNVIESLVLMWTTWVDLLLIIRFSSEGISGKKSKRRDMQISGGTLTVGHYVFDMLPLRTSLKFVTTVPNMTVNYLEGGIFNVNPFSDKGMYISGSWMCDSSSDWFGIYKMAANFGSQRVMKGIQCLEKSGGIFEQMSEIFNVRAGNLRIYLTKEDWQTKGIGSKMDNMFRKMDEHSRHQLVSRKEEDLCLFIGRSGLRVQLVQNAGYVCNLLDSDDVSAMGIVLQSTRSMKWKPILGTAMRFITENDWKLEQRILWMFVECLLLHTIGRIDDNTWFFRTSSMNGFCTVEVYALVFEDGCLEKVAGAHAGLANEWGPQGQIDVKNGDSCYTFYELGIDLNMCF